MTKKWYLLVVLMLIGALTLAACGGGDTEEPADSGDDTTNGDTTMDDGDDHDDDDDHSDGDDHDDDLAGTVELWHAYGTGGAEEEAITAIVASIQEEHPELTINVLQIPFDQIFNKWETEVAAGSGPDMFIAPNDDLGNLSRSGLVLDITDLLDGKLENVVDTGVAGMMVDGQMYGVPESAKAVALYYNKSMVDTPPTTTDELLQAVEDGHILVQNQNGYHLFGFFPAFGGQILDDAGTTACSSGEEGFVKAMQYLVDLKEAGALYETDGGRADTLFRNGEVAMIINGPWTLGDYRADLGDDLGVAPIPGSMNPAGALNGIDGFYINPNTDNPELAVAVALELTDQESSQMYTDMAGHVPIRTDVTSDDPNVAAFAEASANGTPRPQSAAFGNYWGPFGDMVTKVLEGNVTPEEGVAEACGNFQAAIDG
ncbi:MAG TPA: extracellular solute-binding protein [Anaerolineae bacterium]|nr:extracellular solute-binding protein [Anaerolineae bacterium]